MQIKLIAEELRRQFHHSQLKNPPKQRQFIVRNTGYPPLEINLPSRSGKISTSVVLVDRIFLVHLDLEEFVVGRALEIFESVLRGKSISRIQNSSEYRLVLNSRAVKAHEFNFSKFAWTNSFSSISRKVQLPLAEPVRILISIASTPAGRSWLGVRLG